MIRGQSIVRDRYLIFQRPAMVDLKMDAGLIWPGFGALQQVDF
jgi:hypothetical protein